MKKGSFTANGNVNWKFTPIRHVDAHRFNQILDVLENKLGMTRTYPEKGKFGITAYYKLVGHYIIMPRGSYGITAAIYLEAGTHLCAYRITTQRNKVEDMPKCDGWEAYARISDLVKKRGKHLSVATLYGAPKDDEIYWLIKKCVPCPVNYAEEDALDQFRANVFKGDVSSCYPFELSKSLPTLFDYKRVPGRVPANEEYPFAFHLADGSVEILNEFDSAYFYDRPEYKYKNNETELADETILCHACDDYSLSEVIKILYSQRRAHPEYKDWMNLFVGFCQLNKNPRLAQISAVVIARANHRIFQLCDELRRRSQEVLLINVDSVAWVGADQPDLMTDIKELGAFCSEFRDVAMMVSGPKKYQIKDELGMTKTVWAGVESERQAALAFGEIATAQIPITKYCFDERINRLRYLYQDDNFGEVEGEVI